MWICLTLAAGGSAAVTAGEPETEAGIRMAPSPPPEAVELRMRRWHREYSGRIEPVLREWESLARAARERPGRTLTAGCRRLESALGELSRTRLPAAPDPSISLHLEEALRTLARAVVSCSHGGYFLTLWRLRQADDSWRELEARLRLYGLVP